MSHDVPTLSVNATGLEQQMGHLILIRGLPGSGKSSFARHLTVSQNIFAADDYMVDENGDYDWRADRLEFCHESCRKDVREALLKDDPPTRYPVVVTNTMTKQREIKPYLEMVWYLRSMDIPVHLSVITMNTGLTDAELSERSIHSPPEETVATMRKRFNHNLNLEGLA